jgi:glutathione S-transferase
LGGRAVILIGQYDSPFVRRVAVALKTYGFAYEHNKASVWGHTEEIARYNPLRRVPTLVMDDGEVLTESAAMLAILDDIVGPERATLARTGKTGRDLQRLSGFAAQTAEKAVSLLYERRLRETVFPLWADRCRAQVNETLDFLEAERAKRPTPWLFDDRLSHADVVLATMLRFVSEALADEFDLSTRPSLKAHSAQAEALPVFQEASQPFVLSQPK